MIPQQDSTVGAMRQKVRRLTSSSAEQQLSTATIDQALNTFILQDFPYAIKLDQMRSVYTFYTSPNIDRYPLDVNYNQGVRSPVYFEGINGYFYKDRQQFFNMWPKWPTLTNPFSGDGVTQLFNFTLQPIPILSQSFVLGILGTNGNQIVVADDGNGNLFYQSANTISPAPAQPNQFPGMTNTNLSGTFVSGAPPQSYQTYPGDRVQTNVGTINYVTGVTSINFALANVTPASGALANVWVSQYTVGRSYCLLFWNNEFTVRPVPDKTYKVEVETYLSPIQFLQSTDLPILTQWWQYIAYGASCEILRERQDFDGVAALQEGFKRQEALVLERQGVEEINQRNATIFSESTASQGWNQGQGWPY